ncbi:MAG: KpsF/GutQ family sugar-phosphate isomerase [Alphaproteobacteria bacterium]|nr:KpsF/GutQ family sugar-phosphate isomerase [Alphaproteobacteria bacterium]
MEPATSAPAPGTAVADVLSARRVLDIEAEALRALGASLGDELVRALDTLGAVRGRVVVTGMGKSGHVARKIAATLASTGSLAFFVHPAEASHGDLGMIARGDAVIALSNSGETVELSDIVAYTRRFAIPLIAITGRAGSSLAQAADIVLLLPKQSEACPLGLAPTTSTTMMLALGDALAVALFERRGFSVADFRLFHPGGRLGNALLKVADLMHGGDAMPVVSTGVVMAEAILVMTEKRLGCVGVVGNPDGRLLGIITDGDLRRHLLAPALLGQRAGDVMTRAPKVVHPNSLAVEALRVMNENAITTLFVVEDERPVGLLHVHDCLRFGMA